MSEAQMPVHLTLPPVRVHIPPAKDGRSRGRGFLNYLIFRNRSEILLSRFSSGTSSLSSFVNDKKFSVFSFLLPFRSSTFSFSFLIFFQSIAFSYCSE